MSHDASDKVRTFVDRWRGRPLTERASAQSHFNDLCDVLGVPRPTDQRETDSTYGFEARTELAGSAAFAKARKAGADDASQRHLFSVVTGSEAAKRSGGFCDVWKKDHFCWEYKRPGKYSNLDAVFAQLNFYRNDLGNPPLLIACDIDTIEIRTNFTGFVPKHYVIRIDDLLTPSEEWKKQDSRSPMQVLRLVFENPEALKPRDRVDKVTEELAKTIGELAKALREADHDPEQVAHFLMQLVFCFFAEDAGLLPKDLMTRLIGDSIEKTGSFMPRVRDLFAKMATGGWFGEHQIRHFNGGLFVDGESVPDGLSIGTAWLGKLKIVGNSDWANVEPSIFGTLFERSLDPDKRSQIGAHYTSREDIMLVIEPVILRPLRREWVETQETVTKELAKRAKAKTDRAKKNANERIREAIDAFHTRLWSVTVLDPACGSGNFLYVALQSLLDLELEVRTFAAREEINQPIQPRVGPHQLKGIEINTYAAELARIVIWIGYLQWHRQHGDVLGRTPILERLDAIENRDAILAWADENGNDIPVWREGASCKGQAWWPQTDFIVGNPPFLGSKVFRASGVPDAYLDAVYSAYDIPNTSDLCCYWFRRALHLLEAKSDARVGLLATQGIRGGTNHKTLELITRSAVIFAAWSDRKWVLDGAAVQVSIIAFATAPDDSPVLDGSPCAAINSDLTSGLRLFDSKPLPENDGICFQGQVVVGPFDVESEVAREMLAAPNSCGGPSIDVVLPVLNGRDLTGRPRGFFIVDFDQRSRAEAAGYDAPFKHVETYVKPKREKNRDKQRRERWWQHGRAGTDLRAAIGGRDFQIVTPRVSKHRLFRKYSARTRVTDAAVVFARSDDYFFGVLHSSIHELWALRQGTQLEDRPRYTPTTCFETFPLPWSPASESSGDPLHGAISTAASELDTQRERWLNPPEWVKPIEDKIDRFDSFDDVAEVSGEEARRLIRQSAIDAACAEDKRLKKRTLTNLYNERPAWLAIAHEKLDRAVIAAYASVDPEGDWDPDWAEVFKATGAAQPTTDEAEAAKREEIEQKILANLLRMNQEKVGAEK
ncbi:MAG: class I SAM-dependent DNA methyltransferase [Phycisphaerales bacterium]